MRRGLVLVLSAALAACSGDDSESPETSPDIPLLPAGAFAFTESAVVEGKTVDPRFTCDGEDISPALSWEGVPEGSAELALVMEDPDAPGGTFTHWLLYSLDASETALAEGVPEGGTVAGPPALRQGTNDFGTVGYGGPCPPGGETHRYVFRLLALDEPVTLQGGASRDDLLGAIEGHVVAETALTATYSRS